MWPGVLSENLQINLYTRPNFQYQTQFQHQTFSVLVFLFDIDHMFLFLWNVLCFILSTLISLSHSVYRSVSRLLILSNVG